MNGTSSQPATNANVILLVVICLGINVTIGMSSLAYCLVFKVEPNTTLLTSFIGVVNYVFGVISGMLVKTSPTESTKQPLPNPPTIPTSVENPVPMQVVNKPENPVPVEEAPK